MAFRGPGMGPFGPQEICALCGRDLWEVDRYISAGMIKVCDRCIADSRQVIEEAEATGAGPELYLPSRVHVFGDVPHEKAVEEIVTAFERAFTTDSSYVEDFEALRPYLEEHGKRVADRVKTSRVNRIRFVSPDQARVQFSLTLTSGGTFPIDGGAVRIDGRWKVSRETQVHLVRRGGGQIP